MFLKPDEFSPYFSYGSVISYKFVGNVSKDRNKYRFRFQLLFENGITLNKQQCGFATIRAANESKELLIHELLSNTYCPFDFTVKEFLEYWVFHVVIKEMKLSFNTQQGYCNVVYNHIIPFLKPTTKLSSITPEKLLKLVESRTSDIIKKRTLHVLRISLGYAYHKHYIKTKPAEMANEIFRKTYTIKRKKRDVVWTIDTIKLVLIRCREDFPDIYMPVLLSLMLGTRVSETLAIKYQDIDFTSKTVYISKQIGYKWDTETFLPQKGEITTKSQNGNRFIPLPDWVAEEIILKRTWYEEMKTKVPTFQDLDYICCRHDGTPYYRAYWAKQFKTLMDMCGLSAHWHDMRHVYATMLKNNSLNVKAISKFLGHATPAFTEDVYITQKETAYDCTVLEKYWERMQKPVVTQDENLVVPFVQFAQKLFSKEATMSRENQ